MRSPVDEPDSAVPAHEEPTPGLIQDALSEDIARLMEWRRGAHRAAAAQGVEILAIGRNSAGDAYQLTLRHRASGETVTNEVETRLTPALAAWRVGLLCGDLAGDPRAALACPDAVELAVKQSKSPAEARLIRKWGPVCEHGVYTARCSRCSAEPVTAEPPDTAETSAHDAAPPLPVAEGGLRSSLQEFDPCVGLPGWRDVSPFKKGDRAFWRGSRLPHLVPTSRVRPGWGDEVVRSDREVVIRELGQSGPIEVSVVGRGIRFDPSVAPSLLEPLPAWHVGQRAHWAVTPLPGGGSICFTTPIKEPTPEEAKFRRKIGRDMDVTLLALRENGYPTLARSDDGFEFDPSVDISCLRHIPPPPPWRVGDRAMWRGAPGLPKGDVTSWPTVTPAPEAGSRINRNLLADFPVTITAVAEDGRPTEVVSDIGGVRFDPSVEISFLERSPTETATRDPRLSSVLGGTPAGPRRDVHVRPDGYGVDIVPKTLPIKAEPAGLCAALNPLMIGLYSGAALETTGVPMTRAGRQHDTFRSDVTRDVAQPTAALAARCGTDPLWWAREFVALNGGDQHALTAWFGSAIQHVLDLIATAYGVTVKCLDIAQLRREIEARTTARTTESVPAPADAILLTGPEADAYRAFQSASIALEDAHRSFKTSQQEHAAATAALGRAASMSGRSPPHSEGNQ